VTAAIFGLGSTLWLYAHQSIDGLQALFSMKMSMLTILWFGFHLKEAAEDWPISIWHTAQSATPVREGYTGWKFPEQNAA